MALLLAHLLKGQLQPDRRGASWRRTIRVQRDGINRRLARTPSLQPMLSDADGSAEMWGDAVALAATETGLADFPDCCPWSFQGQILDDEWLPD